MDMLGPGIIGKRMLGTSKSVCILYPKSEGPSSHLYNIVALVNG